GGDLFGLEAGLHAIGSELLPNIIKMHCRFSLFKHFWLWNMTHLNNSLTEMTGNCNFFFSPMKGY
uniref:hypothetical protein n=1 Tax=Acidocella sp. C78 TaxID=1671486 RepID=UPI001BD43132